MNCEQCGKPTQRGMHHGHRWGPWKKFCSAKCRAIKARKTIKAVNKKYMSKFKVLRSKHMLENNPMKSIVSRNKMSATHKALGIRPIVRGGNGQKMPVPQRMLLAALGEGWYAEHSVATKLRSKGYPTCYKIDIANPVKMIAIEIDGGSHGTLIAQKRDKIKQTFLVNKGWKFFRFTNKMILGDIELALQILK